MEALKPLVVLGLLGTILYGAYLVVQKGPGQTGPAWPAATQTDIAQGGMAADAPPFAPVAAPAIEMPAPVASQPLAAPPINATNEPAIAQPPAQFAGPPAFSGPPQPAAIPEPPAALASAPPVAAPLPDQPPTFLNARSAPPPVAETAAAAALLAAPGAAPSSFSAEPPAAFAADPVAAAAPTAPMTLGAAAAAAGSAAFATAWAEAHDKLAAARYAEGLAALSIWHDDPSLSVEESQRLEDLLGQLAGTVIYSQQDLLLPPHIVAAGDTLQSIAGQLAVPWQLLAKINGVADPARLVPGEHLKVVRGPFDAVVSVSRRRLSLQVGGNYAGSFPVVIGRQVQDRIGASLAVIDVRRGGDPSPSAGPVAQVAFVSPAAAKSIVLGDGLSIEAAEDPGLVVDSAPQASLIVSANDLEEIIDILGPGSHVLVRK